MSGEQQHDEGDVERSGVPSEGVFAKLWGWSKIFASSHALEELDEIERRDEPPRPVWMPEPGGLPAALRTLALCISLMAGSLGLTWLVSHTLPEHARGHFLLWLGGSIVSGFFCIGIPYVIHHLRGRRDAKRDDSAERDSSAS